MKDAYCRQKPAWRQRAAAVCGRSRRARSAPVFSVTGTGSFIARSFRRLKHKTQVFLAPSGDHYRTRLTHTLEVAQIARTIARALQLNEDLTEAIALGHDLGHTPFGHAGERALNSLCSCGFTHYAQSVRTVEKIEKNGAGLNLTDEVKNGILCHTKGEEAYTLEGQIIRIADKSPTSIMILTTPAVPVLWRRRIFRWNCVWHWV